MVNEGCMSLSTYYLEYDQNHVDLTLLLFHHVIGISGILPYIRNLT